GTGPSGGPGAPPLPWERLTRPAPMLDERGLALLPRGRERTAAAEHKAGGKRRQPDNTNTHQQTSHGSIFRKSGNRFSARKCDNVRSWTMFGFIRNRTWSSAAASRR